MVVVVSVVAQVVVELGGSVGCVELMQDVGDRLLRLEKLAQEESLSSWLRVLEVRWHPTPGNYTHRFLDLLRSICSTAFDFAWQ